jgi:hypothetical protein
LDLALIGCGDDVAPHLRRELISNGANLEFEFPDVSRALDVLRSSRGKRRVLILRLEPFASFEDLGRLCHVLPDCSVVVMMDSSGDDRIQLNMICCLALIGWSPGRCIDRRMSSNSSNV